MNKIYIYDLEKVYFYIEHGVRPIEAPKKHDGTGKIYFTFDKDKTQEVYKKWLERPYKKITYK